MGLHKRGVLGTIVTNCPSMSSESLVTEESRCLGLELGYGTTWECLWQFLSGRRGVECLRSSMVYLGT